MSPSEAYPWVSAVNQESSSQRTPLSDKGDRHANLPAISEMILSTIRFGRSGNIISFEVGSITHHCVEFPRNKNPHLDG